jgi:hypothetical protein
MAAAGFEAPAWACAPDPAHDFWLDVIKEGVVVGKVPLASAVHLLGRQPDAVQTALEHPSVSRVHCALVHRAGGELFIYDLGSTHGTLLNRKPLRARALAPLPIGSVFRLGQSSRLFCVCGPAELLPPETEPIRIAETAGRTQAARGAAVAAAAPTGPSARAGGWGQADDAEDDEAAAAAAGADESLPLDELLRLADARGLRRNERQAQLLDKLQKRRARMSHLEAEAGRIQAKASTAASGGGGGGGGGSGGGGDDDDGGDGLSGGQRAQLDRCLQLMEEHTSASAELEALLVGSVRKQLGMRALDGAAAPDARRAESGSDASDGDDDFFDRTRARGTARGAEAGGGAGAGTAERDPAAARPATVESLRAAREVLQRRERTCERELLALRASGGAHGQPAGGAAADPLDSFMAAHEGQMLASHAARLGAQLDALRAELSTNEQLLRLAQPALDASLPLAPRPTASADRAAAAGADAAQPPPSKRPRASGAAPAPAALVGPAPRPQLSEPRAEQPADAAAAVATDADAGRPSEAALARAAEWQRAISALQQPAAEREAAARPGAQPPPAASAAPLHFKSASQVFLGARHGQVFKLGGAGLGYYEDTPLHLAAPADAADGGRSQVGAGPQPRACAAGGLGSAPAAGAGGCGAHAQPSAHAKVLESAQLQHYHAAQRAKEASVRPGLNLAANPPHHHDGGSRRGAAGDVDRGARGAAAAQPAAVAAVAPRVGARDASAPHERGGDELDGAGASGAVWQPPTGQTGDGKTSLNARLGY